MNLTSLAFIDDENVTGNIKSELKKIKQNKRFINTNNILDNLFIVLSQKYQQNIQRTEYGVTIKLNSIIKSNNIIQEIRNIIESFINIDINIDLLFKFIVENKNIRVKIKRNV